MTGEMEAAGAAVTAGLAASVIDESRPAPRAGESVHPGACANCGEPLHGAFCSACGQAGHVHRTLGHMVEEFLHGLLHFDSRMWRTIPLLVFRPGTLTHDYVHGKRQRYISPLALFLLAVFAMFVVFAVAGGSAVAVNVSDPRPAEHSRRVDHPGATIAERAGIHPEEGDIYTQIREAYERGDIKVHTFWPYLDEKVKHKLENPELAAYKLQNAAYKFSFLLVPISLPFVWLMFFWRRGVTLFDHAVYILYSLSFLSIVFIVVSILSEVGDVMDFVGPYLGVAILAHSYFHLKGAYGLGWGSALWRMPVLGVFTMLGWIVFILAILIVGLAG